MNIKFLLSLLILGFVFVACSPETEVEIPQTELHITVYKNGDTAVARGAVVVLFDDENTFFTQISNHGNKGSIMDTVADGNGEVVFKGLKTDKKYFVMAYVVDSLKFARFGYKMYEDNSLTGYEVLRFLNEGSITYASVDIVPSDALVSFYAGTNNTEGVPVQIFVDSIPMGTITQIKNPTDTVPINPASNPVQNGVITAKVQLGVVPSPVRFVNNYECNNIQKLDVRPGNFSAVDANVCDAGLVSFWTVDGNKDILPISITINNNNVIGELDTTARAEPTTLKSPFYLNTVLEPGRYTYFATATGCNWQGEFTVESKKQLKIRIARCENNQ